MTRIGEQVKDPLKAGDEVMESILTLSSADESVTGKYQCEARNSVGEAKSSAVTIEVIGKILPYNLHSYFSVCIIYPCNI